MGPQKENSSCFLTFTCVAASLSICIEHPAFKKQGPELRTTIRAAVRAALRHENAKGKLALSVICADDARLQQLNHDFRGKDKPTNVLAFPDGSADERGHQRLGDIILSLDTLVREAQEQRKTFNAHLTHLIIHSTLHLLGYDHEVDEEAEAMEAKEIEILKGMGIANPYH